MRVGLRLVRERRRTVAAAADRLADRADRDHVRQPFADAQRLADAQPLDVTDAFGGGVIGAAFRESHVERVPEPEPFAVAVLERQPIARCVRNPGGEPVTGPRGRPSA